MKTKENSSGRGVLALGIVVCGWLIFAWALADYDTPLPNGAMSNRSEAQLGVLFIGVIAVILAGVGVALAASRLRESQHDRFARVALALGILTFFAAVTGWRVWSGG